MLLGLECKGDVKENRFLFSLCEGRTEGKSVFAGVEWIVMFLFEQELFYHCVICYAKSLSHCYYCCSLLLFVLISNFFLYSVRNIV